MRLSYLDGVAIAGIGATDFSKDSGRSELHLALEAVIDCLRDAGIPATEVDGLVTFTEDESPEIDIARALRFRELRFFDRIEYGGGGGCATIQHGAMAVATGVATTVICYRAFNERSGFRFGTGAFPIKANQTGIDISLYRPHGLINAAALTAIVARRYMHEYGATSEDFGRVSVAARRFAATNPKAWFFERPISLEDHQASPWIAEPVRRLDCCQESDGGVAILVTTLERSRELQQPPVRIRAAAQASARDQRPMTSFYDRDIADGIPGGTLLAEQLWAQSGLRPSDMQVGIIYDHFTPLVLMQLEDLGFCKRGEAPAFVAAGNLDMGGMLPLNTNGGQLGEGYIHGMNGIAEAVRQVRGTAVNQVRAVEHVVVTSGSGPPTSGLVVGKDG
jgi:acetyl-CoA acetyltransferase